MGETPGETRQEIESLRAELGQIIDELERRGQSAVQGPARALKPIGLALLVAVPVVSAGIIALIVVRRRRKVERRQSIRDRAAWWLATGRQRWQHMVHPPEAHRDGAARERDREETRERMQRMLWAAASPVLTMAAERIGRQVAASLWERAMHEKPPDDGTQRGA